MAPPRVARGFRRQTKWLTRQTLAHAFKGLSAPPECVAAVEAALRELSGRRVRVPTQLEVQP